MTKIVYTCITGNYDKLLEPSIINSEWTYICFTDNESLVSKHWDIKLIDNPDKIDLTRLNRQYKILPHKYLPEHDLSLYIDGNMRLVVDPNTVEQQLTTKFDMLSVTHPDRICIYQEAKACIRLNKDIPRVIEQHIKKYKLASYPVNNGLHACGFMLRYNNNIVQDLMNHWHSELSNGSKRDQLSFNYSLWRTGLAKIKSIPVRLRDKYIQKGSHLV